MTHPPLPDRWQTIAPLLDAALERPRAERRQFLDQACKDDADLRGTLEKMLNECERDDATFDGAAPRRFAALFRESGVTVGTVLGDRYRIEREIGAGGMATVYLARDIRHDRDVALKILNPDLGALVGVDRFLAEIKVTANLNHPNLVPLFDSGVDHGTLFYVMPFVDGESLRARLGRQSSGAAKAWSALEAISVWRELLDALSYAHSRGVVHRDIKPENILLSDRHVFVSDFGIARAIQLSTNDARVTASGLALGTPAYMAPEQAVGDRSVDHRADIYAAGLVMYEMLAGASPFSGQSAQELIAARLTGDATMLSPRDASCPPELGSLVMRCLARDPSQRPQTVDAILAELDSLVTRPVTRSKGAGVRRRRTMMWAVSMGATAIVLGLAGVRAARTGRLAFGTPATPAHDSLRVKVLLADRKFDPADSTLAENYASAVLADLAQDPWVFVITPNALQQTAQVAGFSQGSLIRDTLVFFAQRLGTNAYLALGVSRAGSGYVFSAEAIGSKADNSLGVVSAAANSAADIPTAMRRVADQLRRRLVSARAEIPRTPSRPRVTDVSPQALELLDEAGSEFERANYRAAANLYRQAVRADSNFFQAWRALSGALWNSNERGSAYLDALSRAYRLRDRARSPVERLGMEARYWYEVGMNDRAAVLYDSLDRLRPERGTIDGTWGTAYGGQLGQAALLYRNMRRYDVAIRLFRRNLDTLYEHFQPWTANYITALADAGRLGEARIEVARMMRADSLNPRARGALGTLLVREHDWDAYERFVSASLKRDTVGDRRTGALASARDWAAVRGRLAQSDSFERTRDSLMRGAVGGRRNLAEPLARAGTRVTRGDTASARAIIDSALVVTPWRSIPALDRPYIAMISMLTAIGDRAGAAALISEWSRERPAEFKMMDSLDVVASAGDLALATGHAREALRLFRIADVRGCEPCFFPRYARAYDQLKVRDSAIVWYERYVESPVSTGLPTLPRTQLPLAYRRLGELYEERGNWKKAADRYQDFVNLWRDADPALQPAVTEARSRVARLRAHSG